jgi:hypothetical protein
MKLPLIYKRGDIIVMISSYHGNDSGFYEVYWERDIKLKKKITPRFTARLDPVRLRHFSYHTKNKTDELKLFADILRGIDHKLEDEDD